MKAEKIKLRSRMLSAKWTVNLKPGEVEIGEEIQAELAKTLQEEIDWEILADLMENVGWYKVILTQRNPDIPSWVKENCKARSHHRNNIWLFESKQDAEWFTLKWV